MLNSKHVAGSRDKAKRANTPITKRNSIRGLAPADDAATSTERKKGQLALAPQRPANDGLLRGQRSRAPSSNGFIRRRDAAHGDENPAKQTVVAISRHLHPASCPRRPGYFTVFGADFSAVARAGALLHTPEEGASVRAVDTHPLIGRPPTSHGTSLSLSTSRAAGTRRSQCFPVDVLRVA